MGNFFGDFLGNIPIVGPLIDSAFGIPTTQSTAQNAAGDIAKQQQGQYNTLFGQGQTLFNGANTNLGQTQQSNPLLQLYQTGQSNNPLIQQYAQAAGLNIPGYSAPPGYVPGTPGGGFNPQGVPNVADPRLGGVPGSPATAPGSPAQSANSSAPTYTPSHPYGPQMDAYGLTGPQSVQLNQQLDLLHKRAQSNISQYQSQLHTQGISPTAVAEGAARLQSDYDQIAEGSIAQFAEKARADREQALAGLLQSGQSAYNQNTGLQENLISQGLGTSAGATAGLSNPQQAQQQIAQQAQAQQAANANAIAQALGYGFGGGFGGSGSLFGGGGRTPGITDMSQLVGPSSANVASDFSGFQF